jgi:hypothetical protein
MARLSMTLMLVAACVLGTASPAAHAAEQLAGGQGFGQFYGLSPRAHSHETHSRWITPSICSDLIYDV